MLEARLRRAAFWTLVVITVFNAVSAIGGGIGMLATNGLGMPASFLAGGPFTTFLWPALILLIVVGGSQALAAALLLARRESALLWSAVAGFGLTIWIFTETGMIRGFSWLQILYFVTGTLQLVLVVALLGIVGWLPRAPLSGQTGQTRQTEQTRQTGQTRPTEQTRQTGQTGQTGPGARRDDHG